MLEKCHEALLTNDDILFFMRILIKFTYFTNNLAVNFGKINLGNDNKVQANLELLLKSELWLGGTNLKNSKH